MSFIYEALREQMLLMGGVRTVEREEWERQREVEEEMLRLAFEEWEEEGGERDSEIEGVGEESCVVYTSAEQVET
jgi:hypothetical protein